MSMNHVCLCTSTCSSVSDSRESKNPAGQMMFIVGVYVSAAIVWLQPPNHVTFTMDKRREVEISRHPISDHHNMYRLIKIGTADNGKGKDPSQ